jgi:hypothetical protein
VWPRLGVIEHFPHLLGGDGQVDGADEPKGCGVDELQADLLAWLHGHPR